MNTSVHTVAGKGDEIISDANVNLPRTAENEIKNA